MRIFSSILTTIIWIECCELDCQPFKGFICISDNLAYAQLEKSIAEILSPHFSTCHYDVPGRYAYKMNLKDELMPAELPTVAVTIIDCETKINSIELSIVNRRRWSYDDCSIDYSFLIVHNQGLIETYLLQRTPRTVKTRRNFEVLLPKNYTLVELPELLKDVIFKMESNTRLPTFTEQENILQVNDVKEHWPNWAIYVVIICILLTAFAFLIGNCITKRASPLRFKGPNPKAPKTKRNWGAGFSGGLWAAA